MMLVVPRQQVPESGTAICAARLAHFIEKE